MGGLGKGQAWGAGDVRGCPVLRRPHTEGRGAGPSRLSEEGRAD